jgi:hypothetical protein
MSLYKEQQSFTLYGGDVVIDFTPPHVFKKDGVRLKSPSTFTGMIDKSPFLIPWAVGLTYDHLYQYLLEHENEQLSTEQLFEVVDEAARKYKEKQEQAKDVGDIVHEYAMRFAIASINGEELPKIPSNGDLSDYELDEDQEYEAVSGIYAFIEWYNEHDVTFHDVERVVYSAKHDYVGTVDVAATVDGEELIIDYKTSKRIYTDHLIQAALYAYAYAEEREVLMQKGYEVQPFYAHQFALLHFSKSDGDFEFVRPSEEVKERATDAALSLVPFTKNYKELDKKWSNQ